MPKPTKHIIDNPLHRMLALLLLMAGLCGYSQNQRPHTPQWHNNAKFGIFIHWGVYSVPAWNYAGELDKDANWSEKFQAYGEWYWHSVSKNTEKAIAFHDAVYGQKVSYQDLASQFKAELFNPEQWAGIFKDSGAKYVVMVAKHHDGFALWPSEYSWNWNSMDVGPHRDLLGDLASAVKNVGLKMGVSYSLDSWFDPMYLNDFEHYVDHKLQPQLRELVTSYEPDIIVAGGHVQHTVSEFKNDLFLDWLFTRSPVKDSIVVNDRWGKNADQNTGSYYNTQYSDINNPKPALPKWEEMRGMGKSFGYSRMEDLRDYSSSEELVKMLVKVVSTSGNLLLNIGPTADGRIPVIMQQRLSDIGEWLRTNGEAIYGTKPFENKIPGFPNITETNEAIYIHLMDWPEKKIEINGLNNYSLGDVKILGIEKDLKVTKNSGKISFEFPYEQLDVHGMKYVYVLKIEKN